MAPPPTRRLRGVLAPGDVIRLEGDAVVMLDQTRLPGERVDRRCGSTAELCAAIRELAIRGAPAIGIAAAMGMAQAARRSTAASAAELRERARERAPGAGRVPADGDQSRLGARPLRRGDRAERRGGGGVPGCGSARAARAAHPRGRGRPLPRDGAPRRRPAAGRARACSRTATPAGSRPAATAPRSASCAPPTTTIRASTSGSTRRARCCRALA